MSSSAEAEAEKWSKLIQAATPKDRPFVTAHTFVRRFESISKPALLDCDDGNQYVVKALRHDTPQGRMLFNDQIVARAGLIIDAPVPTVKFVNVPKELIDLNASDTQLGHFRAGLAHGSQLIPNVSDDKESVIKHVETNKARFAALSVLYGLMHCGDRQFLYEKTSPFRVYSHDHGHFFPGGPDWTPNSLNSAGAPSLENELITGAGLSSAELTTASKALSKLTDVEIASIVALPPDEWGVLSGDRASLAAYIARRRDALLKATESLAS